MRLGPDRNVPAAPLRPAVAILQMAFARAMKDSTGGTLYRGGLIYKTELDEEQASGNGDSLACRCG
jgi:hypothetical protein